MKTAAYDIHPHSKRSAVSPVRKLPVWPGLMWLQVNHAHEAGSNLPTKQSTGPSPAVLKHSQHWPPLVLTSSHSGSCKRRGSRCLTCMDRCRRPCRIKICCVRVAVKMYTEMYLCASHLGELPQILNAPPPEPVVDACLAVRDS